MGYKDPLLNTLAGLPRLIMEYQMASKRMAQDDEQDNLMRRAADMGYLDLEESGTEPGIDCVCQNNKRVNIPVDTFDKY